MGIDDDLSNILEDSGKIIGAFRHASVHPGGVVMCLMKFENMFGF